MQNEESKSDCRGKEDGGKKGARGALYLLCVRWAHFAFETYA
jgi:hypothetical protein